VAVRHDQLARGERHGNAKLSRGDVVEMRRQRAEGRALKAIAGDFGVSPQNVYLIVNRKAWAHV
jgi:hypothetical protein